MTRRRVRGNFLKLDRMTPEERSQFYELYRRGTPFADIARRMSEIMGRPVSNWAVANYCQARIREEAERAARLQRQADIIAKAIVKTDAKKMNEKTRAALQAVFFNLLNDTSEENLTDVARELRELEKVDVARERVAVEQKKVQISQKQLELKNRELEARLAAGREALAQVEQAVTRGHSTLPADVLAKLKEAYGIN